MLKREDQNLLKTLSITITRGEGGESFSCAYSIRLYASSCTRLPRATDFPIMLRLQPGVCYPRIRASHFQAASLCHSMCGQYPLQRRNRPLAAQKEPISDLCCSNTVMLEWRFSPPTLVPNHHCRASAGHLRSVWATDKCPPFKIFAEINLKQHCPLSISNE